MKKVLLVILSTLFLTGCSIVRIKTNDIDSTLNAILTKNNKLFNQVGQGYKYYLPAEVNYIDSDESNDILYSNGVYYYLYIDSINYYYKNKNNYKEDSSIYYSKLISKKDGYKSNGYLNIEELDNDLYYLEFVYNYAKIEAMVNKEELNNTVLNSAYILSTIKYNNNIVDLMLRKDYFTNKTEKYNKFNLNSTTEKFKLQKENINKEG